MTIFLINTPLSLICILISVAFFTLIERKVIGIIQQRKGPNKASIQGSLQPIRDAGKLIRKNFSSIPFSKKNIKIIAPQIAISIMLAL